MRGGAEAALLLEVVHLHNHAVGVVAELVALGFEPAAVLQHAVHVADLLRARVDGEPARGERFEHLPVRGARDAVDLAHVVEIGVERPRRGDGGFLLSHRSRRGIARVGEDRRPRFLERGVHLGEGVAAHEDFAPHLERLDAGEGTAERGGDRPDGPQILRDVLADPPVPARGAAGQAAARVEQRHPEPVDLRLADVGKRRLRQGPGDARLELAQVVGAERIVEREHGGPVLNGCEGEGALPAHGLGGAVGRDEGGMGVLERPQLAEQRVVLGVRGLGTIDDVVEVVVAPDLLAQLIDSCGGVGLGRHGRVPGYHRSKRRRLREGVSCGARMGARRATSAAGGQGTSSGVNSVR